MVEAPRPGLQAEFLATRCNSIPFVADMMKCWITDIQDFGETRTNPDSGVPAFADLPSAAKDKKYMVDFCLSLGVSPENIDVVQNMDKRTVTRIMNAVDELVCEAEELNQKLAVIFSFSGHGVQLNDIHIILNSPKPENMWFQLEERLRAKCANKNVFVFSIYDCCRQLLRANALQLMNINQDPTTTSRGYTQQITAANSHTLYGCAASKERNDNNQLSKMISRKTHEFGARMLENGGDGSFLLEHLTRSFQLSEQNPQSFTGTHSLVLKYHANARKHVVKPGQDKRMQVVEADDNDPIEYTDSEEETDKTEQPVTEEAASVRPTTVPPTTQEAASATQITLADGSKYTGQLLQGEPHGHGVKVYPDGKHYEGSFKNGLRDGKGTNTMPNGDVYTGTFCQDKASGHGKSVFASGETYEGDLLNGEKHGRGLHKWFDGRQYEGPWVNNKQHGQATCTYADGTVKSGIWENGKHTRWL